MRTNRNRRLMTGVAGLSISALALTACGPDTTGETAETEDTDFTDVEPADSITFWTNHPGGSQDVESELIEGFTEETGIEVDVVTAGANYEEVSQRFQTAQGTGDVGDVVILSDATWFPNYLNGSLAPVDEALETADVDTSGDHETLFADYDYEGSHYGAPYARSTPLFYYNTEHYEEAGLDEAPETWDEVTEHSEALMDAEVASSAFVFPPEEQYPAWTMSNLVWAYGGSWSEEWDFSPVSSEETVEALEYAQEAAQEWAMVGSGDPADDFSAGAASQMVASTGSLAGVLETADFEVGVGFLPGGPAGDGETPTGGAGMSIASESSPEEQLAAAMFIGHMTNPDSTATFSEAVGYMPVHRDADMSAVYEETPQFEVAVDQLQERARVQDNSRVFLPGGDLALSQMLQRILTSDVDVAEETAALEEEFEGLYERDLATELEE